MDVDRHYIGSVTATTHQEKGIITLESNASRGTALPAPQVHSLRDDLEDCTPRIAGGTEVDNAFRGATIHHVIS